LNAVREVTERSIGWRCTGLPRHPGGVKGGAVTPAMCASHGSARPSNTILGTRRARAPKKFSMRLARRNDGDFRLSRRA
jgi:hypothetical protein